MKSKMNKAFDIKIEDNHKLILPRYPFPKRKRREIEHSQISEFVDWLNPAVLLKDGEFIFFNEDTTQTVRKFCAAHSIPVHERFDAWSCIAEPFLDLTLDDETMERIFKSLEDHGISRAQTIKLRDYISQRMTHYTSLTYEWHYYSLRDVLRAMQPLIFKNKKSWRQFYSDAMKIARLENFNKEVPAQ